MYPCILRPLILLVFIAYFSPFAKAQYIPYYTFSQNTSGTYSALSSPTVLDTGITLVDQRYAVTLPFTFYLDNVAYTNIYIGVNGYISFGTTDPGSGYWLMNSTGTGYRLACGMDCNLAGNVSTSELSYSTTGSSPNRVFTAQWKNIGYTGSSVLNANFQIQLSESSNRVKMVYGSCSLGGSSSAFSAFVGLRGLSSGSYNNRSSSTSSWTSTTTGTSSASNIVYQTGYNPPSGLTFIYDPPLCSAPSAPASLSLFPAKTLVSGSVTAPSGGATGYLVVQTPGSTPLNTSPVNGTVYAANGTLGNGTVVYYGTLLSFTSSGLPNNTNFTYSVYAYNNVNCVNGPVYSLTAKTDTAQTMGPRKYIWQLTSGSSSYTVANNWLPVRNYSDALDTLVFNKGGTITVTSVPAVSINQLEVSNNTNLTLNSAATTIFTISDSLQLEAGSTLTIGGTSSLTLNFTNISPKPNAQINGTLNFNSSGGYDNLYGLTSVTGTVNVNANGIGMFNTGRINCYFSASAVYNLNRNGGSIPQAVFDKASNVYVLGTTGTSINNGSNLGLGNLTWNCPGQTAAIQCINIDSIKGDFKIINTNGYELSLGGGAITSTYLSGDLIQQSGTLGLSPIGSLRIAGTANLMGGAINLNSTTSSGTTLILFGNLNESSSHAFVKSSTGIPTISFAGTTGNQLLNFGGTFATTDVSYELNNLQGASLSGILPVSASGTNTLLLGSWQGSGSFSYYGASGLGLGAVLVYKEPISIKASSVEWPATNGPKHVTTSLTGSDPDNRLWLPGTRRLTGILNMLSGVIVLGSYDLVIDSNSGKIYNNTPYANNMIAADSTGQLVEYVAIIGASAINYTYPLGDITGTTDAALISLPISSNTTPRYIGIRLKNVKHPFDSSSTNYLKRYWIFSDNGSTPFSYRLIMEYPLVDIVGIQNFRLARWNGTSWLQAPSTTATYFPSSPAGSILTNGQLSTTQFPLANAEFAGKSTISQTYSWTGAISQDYQIPGNWTPNRVQPDPSDHLQFNSGNIDTVKNIPPIETIGRMWFTNNTTTILQATSSVVTGNYTINSDDDPTTDEFKIDNGSSVIISGTIAPLKIVFTLSGTLTNPATAIIAGSLEVNTSIGNYVSFLNGKGTVTTNGVIIGSGTAYATDPFQGGVTAFFVNGTYLHKYKVNSSLPVLAWNTGSQIYITGFTTAATLNATAQPVYDLIYNCPNQTGIVSNANVLPTVAGTLSVVSTGTGQWKFNSNTTFNDSINNYLQTGGNVDLTGALNNTNQQQLNVTGVFNQTGGVFNSSATGTSTPMVSFNGTSGVQNVTFYNAAPTGPITYRVNNSAGINLAGSGSLSSTFGLNNNGGLQISVPINNPVATSLAFQYNTGSRLTYDGQGNFNADSITFPVLNGPQNLYIKTGSGNTVYLPGSRTVPVSLQLQSGNIGVGNDTLTLGSSGAQPGTLTYTSGNILLNGGSLKRWYGLTGQPTTSGTGVGYYPIATMNNDARAVSLYFSNSTAITTAGTIALSLNNTSGMSTGLSVADGTYTITTRTNSGWNYVPANGFNITSGTIGLKYSVDGMLTTAIPADLRVMNANSVVGTHVNGSGSGISYVANRTGLSVSNLSGGTFYLGTGANSLVNSIFYSVKTGPWNNGTTWNTGTVPGAGDTVYVSNGDTVSVSSGSSAKYLTINPLGQLVNNGNSIAVGEVFTNNGILILNSGTINLGPVGGGNKVFTSTGVWTVNGGTMNINGRADISGGFNQSNGSIILDPNDSTSAGSILGGATLRLNVPGINLTGGSIMFRDAPFLAGSSLQIAANTTGAISPNHTFIFGDGVSAASHIDYSWDLPVTGIYNFSVGKIVINGSGTGSGRGLTFGGSSTAPYAINGDIVLNGANAKMSSLYAYTQLFVGGNIYTSAGDSVKTNGKIIFGKFSLNASGQTVVSPVTVPQSVNGPALFYNSNGNQTSFDTLAFNNSSTTGVTFNIGDFYFNSLQFTKGLLNTGGATAIASANATFVTPGQTTGWVNGKLQHPFGVLFSPTSKQFPIGDQNYYTPASIVYDQTMFTGNAFASLRISSISGDHPAIASSGILASKSVNRYFKVDTIGSMTNPTAPITLTLNWPLTDIDPAANSSNFVTAHYTTSWKTDKTRLITSSYVNVLSNAGTVKGEYQIGETGLAPQIQTQPLSLTACTGTVASFTVSATAAFTYQWQVNDGTGWFSITNTTPYNGAFSSTLTINTPVTGMNNYQYRCKLYNSYDSSVTNPAVLTVSGSVIPTISIGVSPGTTNCAGTSLTFTATTTNGGSTPTYQWKKNGSAFGSNINPLVTSSVLNGDVITCTLVSSIPCATPTTAASNAISLTVNPTSNPAITISSSAGTTVCAKTYVTFSAVCVDSGSAPQYQWKKNGVNIGTASRIYTDTVSNGDTITCVLTSNIACASSPTAISNKLIMIVTQPLPASIVIAANPGNAICTGNSVTFTATPTNGGTPVYQWKNNGTNVGTGVTFSSSTLSNSDIITCTMTSSLGCVSPAIATSNSITMSVGSSIAPAVVISTTNSFPVCAGTSVVFTATPTGGGTAATYQWKKNSVNVGTGVSFTTTTLANNDTVSCVMTSSLTCASPSTATSNSIIVTVNPVVTPTVSITANPGTTICPSTTATFTASPVNGGLAPAYQWKLNSVNAGTNANVFAPATISNGDVISCILTSNASCPSPVTATSNALTMTVSSYTPPAISISTSSTTVCSGNTIAFTANATNLGSPTSYQWNLNGVSTGITTSTYNLTSPANNDTVTCVLTTTTTCGGTSTITSNKVGLTVIPTTPASVSIVANPGNTICSGTSVAFTGTPTGGGSSPTYQWKVNSSNVGSGGTSYSSTTLANGDTVKCIMTSSAVCPSSTQASSNIIVMVVNPTVTPSITINSASGTTVCSGATVVFNASITNGGSAPTYQWKKNGSPVGTNSSNYTATGLSTGDVITCQLTSNAPCATTTLANSNSLSITVTPIVTPTISISASPGVSICSGHTVLFTATTVNGGSSPTWQWKINGVGVGTNSSTFSSSTLTNGNVITCNLTSSASCVTSTSASSNSLSMNVVPASVPSVTINASPGTNVSAGQLVTFTATVLTGGASPVYQWKKNGINVGTNSNIYSISTLINNDLISVNVTSSDSCATIGSVNSNIITMHVGVGVPRYLFGNISVSPNPSIGSLLIEGTLNEKSAGVVRLELRTVVGALVLNQELPVINHALSSKIQLPDALPNGLYILLMSNENGEMIEKIELNR